MASADNLVEFHTDAYSKGALCATNVTINGTYTKKVFHTAYYIHCTMSLGMRCGRISENSSTKS